MKPTKPISFLVVLGSTAGLLHCWGQWSDAAPTLETGCDGGASTTVSLTYATAYLVNPTTTTSSSTNSSSTSSDGGATNSLWTDASTTTTSTNSTPPTVFVPLTVTASFACAVEGTAHATLSTSVGQLSNGLPASSAGGGAGSDAGSGSAASALAGASGTSVTVLLTDVASPLSGTTSSSATTTYGSLEGYATLQLTVGRQTQLQVVVGDVSSCLQLMVAEGDAAPPSAVITPSICP